MLRNISYLTTDGTERTWRNTTSRRIIKSFGGPPRLDGRGLRGISGLLAKTTMWMAGRIFGLNALYHFRKKFHATASEPLYALKYPQKFKPIDLVRIIALF